MMMRLHTNQKGFTFLELIFVIIILGIVGSIGSSIIVQLYENYITQRAMHRVSVKTELAVNQIVNRLRYRMPSSVIIRNGAGVMLGPLEERGWGTTNIAPEIIEWIGYDNDSFSAQQRPGWSGYCDTNATSVAGGTNAITTPGSDLGFTNTVIRNLSGNSRNISNAALLFSVQGQHLDGVPGSQSPACYGYDGNTTCIHQISSRTGNTILNTDNNITTGVNISTHYKLAWSAYAIVPVNITSTNLFDLELRYNYQPWDGTQYNNASSSTLITNVTSFKFSELGGTVRLKLCATEPIGDINTTVNVSVCKEKVVLR